MSRVLVEGDVPAVLLDLVERRGAREIREALRAGPYHVRTREGAWIVVDGEGQQIASTPWGSRTIVPLPDWPAA